MTPQEVFDTVAKHLFRQSNPATEFDDDGEPSGCFYRAPDGMRCAIGCLIPDDQYNPEFEGAGVNFIMPQVPALGGMDGALLADLQTAHDSWQNWQTEEVMKGVLAAVAGAHGLSPAVLDALSFSRSTP